MAHLLFLNLINADLKFLADLLKEQKHTCPLGYFNMWILYEVIYTCWFLMYLYYSVLKSYTNMTEQSVKIASPKNLTQIAFLCISRYYRFQLATRASNTLRSEQAKNTTINDFVRCTIFKEITLTWKSLHVKEVAWKSSSEAFFGCVKVKYCFSSAINPSYSFKKYFLFYYFLIYTFLSLNNINVSIKR